jgi:hypothetical protein
MNIDNWLGSLGASLVRGASRRDVARAITALLPGQFLGIISPEASDGKGGNKRNKHKHHGNGKKPKKPKDPCDTSFGSKHNRKYCRLMRRQCDGDDPREFCIVDADPSDPDNPEKIADCCEYGETCCGAYCCPEGRVCCGGDTCCREGHTCCNGACCGTDNPYTTCCDGMCMNTEQAQAHCGACGNACGPDEICIFGNCVCENPDCGDDDECPLPTELCSGQCVNTQSDPTNCGQCGEICREGQSCTDGKCEPEGWECCGTAGCHYTTGPNAVNHWHCGGCNRKCPGNQSCIEGECRCIDGHKWCDGAQRCVYEGWECCGNSYCPVKCCEESYCIDRGTCP